MKKFLSIILILMLAFSTVLITACNNGNNEANGGDQSSSSSVEDTSTGRKPGEGTGTPTSSQTPSSSSGGMTNNSSEPNTSSSGNDGGNQNPPTPPTQDAVYSEYPYKYTNTAVMPSDTTSKVGQLDMFIYLFIEDYTKPSLNGTFYDALVSYETMLNALTQAEQASLQNKAVLEEARAAYNDMAKQEAEMLIDKLPNATIDNLTSFGTQANAIQKLVDNMGLAASGISNKTVYDQKVNDADYLLIDTFNAQVAELENFVYEPAYKEKLDYAYVIYGLINAAQQSRVAAAYSKLSTLNTKYADAAVAYSFVDTVNELPSVDQLTDADQAIIKQLKRTYNKMTDAEKAEIPADTMAKYNAYVAKANELWPEHVLRLYSGNKKGDSFFTLVGTYNSASRDEAPVIYEGVRVSDAVKFLEGRSVTFTTTKPGVFTVYANIRNKATDACDLVFSFNGVEIARQAIIHDSTGENTEYVFECNGVGNYELSAESKGDGGFIYYLIFS